MIFLNLRDCPDLIDSAATWFHEKWGVPIKAYQECMRAYLNHETEYGWYLCLHDWQIIGGLGVIENDFHDRKDLKPNICAVYTEEKFRKKGIAGYLVTYSHRLRWRLEVGASRSRTPVCSDHPSLSDPLCPRVPLFVFFDVLQKCDP